MNYDKIYNSIINRAKNREIPNDVYIETHHIIPRCIGGVDTPDNLVPLYPEEHFIAHQLLVKIYPENHKLVCAIEQFRRSNKNQVRNNKIYGWLKRKIAASHSDFMVEYHKNNPHPFKGQKHSKEARAKMREAAKHKPARKPFSDRTKRLMSESAKNKPAMTEETKNKISKSLTGKKKSEDHKKNIGKALKGRIFTEEHKRKITESLKGRKGTNQGKSLSEETKKKISETLKNKPLVVCPHCNKSSTNKNNMKRWHFDNCKLKETS